MISQAWDAVGVPKLTNSPTPAPTPAPTPGPSPVPTPAPTFYRYFTTNAELKSAVDGGNFANTEVATYGKLITNIVCHP